jgi:SAM-dependent methyltransferase
VDADLDVDADVGIDVNVETGVNGELEKNRDTDADRCVLCGCRDADRLFVARDRLVGRAGAFPVARCRGCGLVFLQPRPAPETLATHYPDTYYPLDEEPSTEARTVAEGLLRRVNDWLRASGRGGSTARLLDVGCGTGLFLHLAQASGMQGQGIELSASAVRYARTRYGLDVHEGTLESADLPTDAFDVVVMWHVLEHLPDPVASLQRVTRLLAPGGLLLIAVPNFASVEARVFGRRWYSLDAPRHLYQFTPESLRAVLAIAGLTPERIVQSAGTAGLVYSIMGDLTGVSLRLRHRPLSDPAYHRAAAFLPRMAQPLCVAAARLGRGGALEAYAIKPTAESST